MTAALFTHGSRSGIVATLGLVGLLAAASIVVQMTRDGWYRTDKPAEQILYVRSPEAMRRVVLSYDALAADVYWIRAIQHFGGERRSTGRYDLLYPLLDLATSLDPHFNIAYRFGALFLAEKPPGGPGRPDLAIDLLKKGIKVTPDRWQYYQDAGYVYYFGYNDYDAAAEWFRRGSQIEGAPWFLKSLAAATLAKGHDRHASRLLYQTLAESADNEFMKKDATRRLRQLDTMDDMDMLRAIVGRYRERISAAGRPLTWQTLVAARILSMAPQDRDGFEFTLDPVTGDVALHPESTMRPLPNQEPGQRRSSSPDAAPRTVPWPSPIGVPPMLEPRTSSPSPFVP